MADHHYTVEDPIGAILEAIPSMLAYWDRDLICRYANPAYDRWFGRHGSSLVNTSIHDLLGPKLFALNEPHIRAALDGQLQEFERLIPGPDGIARPSLATYIPHTVNGRVEGFIAQVTEVTPLYKARAELQQRVEECARVNKLLSATRKELLLAQRLGEMGSWTWEIDPDVITWSPQLYEIFGLDADKPAPPFAEKAGLYTPASMALIKTHVQKAMDFGLPYRLELEYFHRSGRRGWLEARGAAHRDASGRVVRLHGTAQEITARRLAKEAVAQSARIEQLEHELAAERSRHGRAAPGPAEPDQELAPGESTSTGAKLPPVLHQAATRMSTADAQRAREAAAQVLNPARLRAVMASRLLDTPPDEVFDTLTSLTARLLKVPACFISVVDKKRDFYLSHHGLQGEIASTRELTGSTFCHYTLGSKTTLVIRDTHAHELWQALPTVQSLGVRAYVGVPMIIDGQNIGSFCVIDTVPRDWSVDDLEVIHQIALSAKRELVLRATVSNAVGLVALARSQVLERERLVAVVAHDLRTPLQILQMGTSLVQRDLARDRAEVTTRMQAALALMKTMVDELTHAPTPEDVRSLLMQPMDVGSLVRDAVEMMSPIAERASISLAVSFLPAATVRIDYGQMLRVLGNLIGNALKYSPPGSVVEVSGNSSEGVVRLTVSDNGIGMTAAEVATAFDRGWQSADGKARGDGAGLGLAIVKSLVTQQRGTVAIASVKGAGTMVTVTLPCC